MKALSKYLKLSSTKLTPFKRKAERMTQALINGDDFFPYMSQSWTGHVKSYLDHEVLFIRYEDLLNSGLHTAKQILSFLGIEKSDEAIMRDLQAQSFETRKTEFDNSKEIERSNHLRQGKSASWKMYLTDTQNEIFYAHFQELMISFNYEL
jgi:hypothetical protein